MEEQIASFEQQGFFQFLHQVMPMVVVVGGVEGRGRDGQNVIDRVKERMADRRQVRERVGLGVVPGK